MKQFCLLILAATFFSCELTYENNKTLLFDGVVVDEDNNALPLIPIKVFTTTRGSIGSGPGSELLGTAFTNEQGEFSIQTKSPNGDFHYFMYINEFSKEGYQENRASYTVVGVKAIGLDNVYKLPDLKVEQLNDVTLELKRNPNTSDTLHFDLYHQWREKFLDLDSTQRIEPSDLRDFFKVNDTLLPSNSRLVIQRNGVLAKSPLTIVYRLGSSIEAEVFLQDIPSDSEGKNYIFEF